MMDDLQALEPRPMAAVRHGGIKYRAWLAACAAVVFIAVGSAGIYHWEKTKARTPDPQAYQLYLQGRRDIQEYTEHGFKQSVVDFQNAIQHDPEYAAGYAGLADAYSYLSEFEIKRPKDVMPLAESNAAKAIEKDPQTAEAYTSLGIVALGYYWDFPLAEQRFRRAIKLNPRDAFTQHFLGHFYEFMGKWQDAVNQMRLALDIEKLSPMYGEDLAYDLLANGRNDDAIRQLRETVGLAPQDPYALALLAIALEASGKTAESLDKAQQAVKLPGMFLTAGSLAGVFCRLLRPDMAQGILKQLEAGEQAGTYVAPLEFAMVHFALGDKKRGLARMTEAVTDHSFNIAFDIADPVFDLVRQDPEFATLMGIMHLPPDCWRHVPRYRK